MLVPSPFGPLKQGQFWANVLVPDTEIRHRIRNLKIYNLVIVVIITGFSEAEKSNV
jgi:hypothetical protein